MDDLFASVVPSLFAASQLFALFFVNIIFAK